MVCRTEFFAIGCDWIVVNTIYRFKGSFYGDCTAITCLYIFSSFKMRETVVPLLILTVFGEKTFFTVRILGPSAIPCYGKC